MRRKGGDEGKTMTTLRVYWSDGERMEQEKLPDARDAKMRGEQRK